MTTETEPFTPRVSVERCGECDACQEWMLDADTAPACTRLIVKMPDGTVVQAGTDRRVYRAIERWFLGKYGCQARARFNLATVVWHNGTCAPPVLRSNRKAHHASLLIPGKAVACDGRPLPQEIAAFFPSAPKSHDAK